MRKRKSPIVLVTALVVVVAGIVGFNFASSKPGGNPADRPPTPEVANTEAVGQARPATSSSEVAQGVKGAMATAAGKDGGPKPMVRGGMPGSGSMLLNPAASASQSKPKPNSSSTSAQWYNKDSALGSGKG